MKDDDRYERMMAMLERIAQPPVVNIHIDFESLLKALDKRRKTDKDERSYPIPYAS